MRAPGSIRRMHLGHSLTDCSSRKRPAKMFYWIQKRFRAEGKIVRVFRGKETLLPLNRVSFDLDMRSFRCQRKLIEMKCKRWLRTAHRCLKSLGEYEWAHLPRAINIPLWTLKSESTVGLNNDGPIIVYCNNYQ